MKESRNAQVIAAPLMIVLINSRRGILSLFTVYRYSTTELCASFVSFSDKRLGVHLINSICASALVLSKKSPLSKLRLLLQLFVARIFAQRNA